MPTKSISESGYKSHKHYAGTAVIDLNVAPVPTDELACLPPKGYEAPEFAMRGMGGIHLERITARVGNTTKIGRLETRAK